MKNQSSSGLRSRLLLWFVLLGVGTLCASGLVAYSFNKALIEELTLSRLKAIADARHQLISNTLDQLLQDMKHEVTLIEEAGDVTAETGEKLHLGHCVKEGLCFDTLLINSNNEVVYSTRGQPYVTTSLTNGPFRESRLAQLAKAVFETERLVKTNYADDELSDNHTFFWGFPVKDSATIEGIVVFQFSPGLLEKLVPASVSEIERTGEIVIAGPIQDELTAVAPLRHVRDAAFSMTFESVELDLPIEKAMRGESGSGEAIDYREVPIFASWYHLKDVNLAMVIKMDAEEVLEPLNRLRVWLIAIFLATLSIAFVIARIVAQSIAEPLTLLNEHAQTIYETNTPTSDFRIPRNAPTEVIELTESLRRMLLALKNSQRELEASNLNLEAQVEDKTLDLQQAMTDLRASQSNTIQTEKMAALGVLAAGVGHEINNPLMGIMNYIDYVRSQTQDKELSQILDKATAAVNRIRDIVMKIMTYARVSSEDITAVNVRSVIQDVVDLISTDLRHAGIVLNIEAPDFLLPAAANSNELHQCVLNILINAMHAVEETQNPTILIRITEGENTLKIHVEDNGPGVPDNISDKIFDPFFTTKPSGKSTGLGLSVTRNLVEKFGGVLKHENVPGGGAAFDISLKTYRQKD